MLLLLFSPKKQRSMDSSDRIEEMIKEIEDYSWDAILICGTWRSSKVEIWETQRGHIFCGETRCCNLAEQEMEIKNCRHWSHQRTCHFNNEQTQIYADECLLLSLGICRPPRRKIAHEKQRSTADHWRRLQHRTGPVKDIKRRSVGQQTFWECDKSGDWLKQWLMIRSTRYTNRRLKKQNTYRSAKGTEKQIDYILKKGNTSAWIKTSKQTTWSIWVWKRFEISKSKARVKQQR